MGIGTVMLLVSNLELMANVVAALSVRQWTDSSVKLQILDEQAHVILLMFEKNHMRIRAHRIPKR